MRRLTYYVAVSLDGCIATRDGDFSAFLAEGDHMATLVTDYADALPAPALEALGVTPSLERFDTVLMGWNTYAVGLPVGLTDPYPHLDTHVFSRRPTDAARPTPPGITLEADDPVEVVRRLKSRPGGGATPAGIWLCGGGQLATVLADEIDELILKVNPIVLGDGIRLFEPPAPALPRAFDLVSSTPYESGVIITTYSRSREVA